MKNLFTRTSAAPSGYYQDACERLIREHEVLKKEWPKSNAYVVDSSVAWMSYLTFRTADVKTYRGVGLIGYPEFREIHGESRAISFSGNGRTESATVLATLQTGHRNILNTPKLHVSLPKDDMLAIATLCRLDKADYAYALYAVLPSEDAAPLKTFSYRHVNSEQKTAYLPLDPAFADKYMIEREKAAKDIQNIIAGFKPPVWRVPNVPSKPEDLL